jgi:hypothetical protein
LLNFRIRQGVIAAVGPRWTVADQIAGRKMKDVATEEEDKCGRRRGGGGIVEEIVAAITSILAPSVYFAISTCLEIHIEVTAVSTRFLICGSSQLSFEILIRNGKERTIYSPYLMHLPFKLVLSNPNY